MKYLLIALLLFVCSASITNGQVQSVGFLMPTGQIPSSDPSLQNLGFNRYTTKNFVINSLDDSQAVWMLTNIEAMKQQCLARWKLDDVDFKHEVRIFVVPNRELLQKIFKIPEPRVEVRRKDGQVSIIGIWASMEDPARVLPQFIAEACLTEYEFVHNMQFGWWAHRGISLLSSNVTDTRSALAYLGDCVQKSRPIYFAPAMLSMNDTQYYALQPEQQLIYDCESVALCLLLRKEFGEAKLLRLWKTDKPQPFGLLDVYGFSNLKEFDVSFQRYIQDLSNDISQKVTPDDYLLVTPAR